MVLHRRGLRHKHAGTFFPTWANVQGTPCLYIRKRADETIASIRIIEKHLKPTKQEVLIVGNFSRFKLRI